MTASASDAALQRYRTRLRKQRLVYFSAIGAIVLALIVTVSVAWSHGEVAHTTLHTVSDPPARLAIASAAATGQVAWRTGDLAATGNPRFAGTVVVYGRHSVRGLDARTGKQTWSYTRSDRTVCTALQTSGTTIAVYRLGGNCDELTAVASDTGRRLWTRTLDQNGQPVNGTPSFQVQQGTFLVTTRSVIYAIDPISSYNRWTYARYGCAINGAVLGSAGALISQTCTDPRCGALKFCRRGPQLFLRDGVAGVDDQNKNPTNYDKIIWSLGDNTDVPVSADGVLTALNTITHQLDLFSSARGASNGSVTLSPAPSSSGPIAAIAAADSELVTVRGVAAVLDGQPGRPAWVRAVTGPLTAVPLSDSADLSLDDARVTVPTSTGAAVLDGGTGQVTRQVTLSPAPPTGSSIYPLGAGQLATSAAGTVAYR